MKLKECCYYSKTCFCRMVEKHVFTVLWTDCLVLCFKSNLQPFSECGTGMYCRSEIKNTSQDIFFAPPHLSFAQVILWYSCKIISFKPQVLKLQVITMVRLQATEARTSSVNYTIHVGLHKFCIEQLPRRPPIPESRMNFFFCDE